MELPPFNQALVTAPQLGQILRVSRQRRRLTQAEVASRLGLSQNRLSHLELHPDEISFKQLLAWCPVVGLELSIGERGVTARETPPPEW